MTYGDFLTGRASGVWMMAPHQLAGDDCKAVVAAAAGRRGARYD